jgi:acetyl esterase/lipase
VQDQTADKVQLILEEDLSLLSNDDYNKYRLNKLKFAVTLDVDQNGVLSISEYTDASPSFVSLDKDGNGSVTFAEYNALVNPDSVNWIGLSLRNVLYKQLGQYRALLDVHYPSSSVPSDPVPAVVFIHGGGWVTGSKEKFDTASFLPVFEKLAAKGVICVAIDYRLVFFDGDNVFMRDCVIDVRDALRFLKKNAAVLGINPDRIAVFGESAGAQLAMMGALSAPGDFVGVAELSDYAVEPCAAVSWYGPVDFTDTNLFVVASDPSINPNRWDGRIGGLRTENPELFTEMSPRFYLKAASPPLLLVHGTEDTTIPVIHSHVMVDQAGAAGASVGFIEVAHSGHNWIPVGGTLDPSVAVIQQQTAGFLLSCLFPQSYADWTAGFGLTGEQASYTADPDGDGASNLNEYAFHGGWPTIKNEQGTLSVFAKIRGVDSRGLEYVYRRRRDAAIRGLSYRLETTTDLVSSVWGTNAVTETGTGTIDADFEQVTNRIETGTSGFVRLNIGLNP